MRGGPCSQTPVVEGATLVLHVDVSALPSASKLTYAWTASAGTPGPANLSTFRLVLPSPPVPITVTVTISNATGPCGFGTLMFSPMSQRQYQQAAFICWLQALLAILNRFPPPRYEPFTGEYFGGNQGLASPLGDPIRAMSARSSSGRIPCALSRLGTESYKSQPTIVSDNGNRSTYVRSRISAESQRAQTVTWRISIRSHAPTPIALSYNQEALACCVNDLPKAAAVTIGRWRKSCARASMRAGRSIE